MRAQFLEKLIKKFPNYMELGAAVKRYYDLRQSKLSKEECEEIVLGSTFSIN
jgi:hypothetical protein